MPSFIVKCWWYLKIWSQDSKTSMKLLYFFLQLFGHKTNSSHWVANTGPTHPTGGVIWFFSTPFFLKNEYQGKSNIILDYDLSILLKPSEYTFYWYFIWNSTTFIEKITTVQKRRPTHRTLPYFHYYYRYVAVEFA